MTLPITNPITNESFWGDPAAITIMANAATCSDVSTLHLLSIAQRMLGDNAPDLKKVQIVRKGYPNKLSQLVVLLERLPNGKTTEAWSIQPAGECQANITETP